MADFGLDTRLDGNTGVLAVEGYINNDGGAILDRAEAMRADDLIIDRALCVIDRESGGKENLAAAGIELTALLTMSEIEAV